MATIPRTSAPSKTVKTNTPNTPDSLNQRTVHSNQSAPTSASRIQARSTQEDSLSTQKTLRNRSIQFEYKPSPQLTKDYATLNIEGKSIWQTIRSFIATLQAAFGSTAELRAHINKPLSEPIELLFCQIARETETLLSHLTQPATFNHHVDQLSQLYVTLGNEIYAKDLPDDFDTKSLQQAIFKGCIERMPTHILEALIKQDDKTWDKYDNLMMGMILEAVQTRCLKENPPPIPLDEVDAIKLNTRIECYCSRFQAGQVQGDRETIGQGAMHTVSKARYSMGLKEEGALFRLQAFKSIQKTFPTGQGMDHTYRLMGMELTSSPRFIERNLATNALAKALDTQVIVDTQPAMDEGEIGIVMEYCNWDAKKDIPTDTKEFFDVLRDPALKDPIIKNPQFIKDLATLRALDYIAGQFDRHPGNILILYKKDTEGNLIYNGLKGIDSDLSWGSLTIPSAPVYTDDGYELSGDYDHYFQYIPPYIDNELAEKILAMTDKDIDTLGENRLTEKEKTAAKERLVLFKESINNGSTKRLSSKAEWEAVDIKTSGLLS